jgi:branched-chain amino acid aminotransferase
VGVSPARAIRAYTILSPVGPYYPTGFKPVKLLADTHHVRAWPGGTGDVKLGSNYALGILPQLQAAKRGYAQILWVFGPEHVVTEVGTMNQFFFWRHPTTARPTLITAPLTDGTILPGVTRDSILQLCRGWGEFDVEERTYTMKEVVSAVESGRVSPAPPPPSICCAVPDPT